MPPFNIPLFIQAHVVYKTAPLYTTTYIRQLGYSPRWLNRLVQKRFFVLINYWSNPGPSRLLPLCHESRPEFVLPADTGTSMSPTGHTIHQLDQGRASPTVNGRWNPSGRSPLWSRGTLQLNRPGVLDVLIPFSLRLSLHPHLCSSDSEPDG